MANKKGTCTDNIAMHNYIHSDRLIFAYVEPITVVSKNHSVVGLFSLIVTDCKVQNSFSQPRVFRPIDNVECFVPLIGRINWFMLYSFQELSMIRLTFFLVPYAYVCRICRYSFSCYICISTARNSICKPKWYSDYLSALKDRCFLCTTCLKILVMSIRKRVF